MSRAFAPAAVVVIILSALLIPAPVWGAPAGSLGPMEAYGTDADGDGLIDIVTLNITLVVTSPGQFYVTVSGPGIPGSNGLVVVLGLGSHVLHPFLRGFWLHELHTDGPYVLNVVVRDYNDFSVIASGSLNTPAWAYTDLDPPGATMASLQTPWLLDTDGNGLFDVIQVNYTLEVTDAGSYPVILEVFDASGTNFYRSFDETTAAAGTAAGHVTLDAGVIRAKAMDGPYRVNMLLEQWLPEGTVPVSGLTVSTGPLTHDAFEPAWVWLLPNATDEGRDVDGDGLYEGIVAHIPVHMARPGVVALAAWLTGSTTWGDPSIFASTASDALSAGDAVIDILFDVSYFRFYSVDGPYRLDVALNVAALQGYTNLTSYTTAAYDSGTFSPSSSTASIGTLVPMDTDSDGKAEFANVETNVTVVKEGDYFVDTSVWDTPRYLTAGRFLHLAPGVHTITARFSGIALYRSNASSVQVSVDRMDALTGDQTAAATFLSGFDPSVYEPRYVALLNGTVTTAAGRPSNALLFAYNVSDGFWTSAHTDVYGHYSLELYNGTFTILVVSSDTTQASTAIAAVVEGATVRDIAMPGTGLGGIDFDAALSNWTDATLNLTASYGGMSAVARVVADVYGNFNGVADVDELGWYVRYPGFPPAVSGGSRPAHFPTTGGAAMRVDNVPLRVGSTAVTQITGAGTVLSADNVTFSSHSLLHNASVPDAHTHELAVLVPSDGLSSNNRMTLQLPGSVIESTGKGAVDVSLTQGSPRTWVVDPTRAYAFVARPGAAWIQTDDRDSQPPVAVATGPGVVERGQPATFRSDTSTDNVGIVNRTWTVNANNTVVTGYGEAFTWTPSEIGTFDVHVQVRDAAGHESGDTAVLRVVDTTAPPSPSNLGAVLGSGGTGPVVNVTWSSVTATDLAGYRLYRSADNGTTWSLLASLAPGFTAYADAAVARGYMYRYRVTAIDRYGNEAAPSAAVTVFVPLSTPTPPSNGTPVLDLGIVVWVGAAAAMAAAGLAAYLLLRRKGREPTDRSSKP